MSETSIIALTASTSTTSKTITIMYFKIIHMVLIREQRSLSLQVLDKFLRPRDTVGRTHSIRQVWNPVRVMKTVINKLR
jgi:hypothetical protein